MTARAHPTDASSGRFHNRHVQNAEMAAREMGGLSLADALLLCELLANTDPMRYERASLRLLQRFIDERLPPLTEVALAASALAELRHGHRRVGVEVLKLLLRQG
jgi:2-polyprenyl-6-methoxyphenol hydroxylase-like FAD-dependent oxidoreductase